MPRRRRTGAIYPVKDVQSKTLKDGTVRKYVRYRAKVAGKWVSAKTYAECNEKIVQALREQATWGTTSKNTRLGEYLDAWIEDRGHDVDPSTIRKYRAMANAHLARYRDMRLADITPTVAKRMLTNMRSARDGGRLAVSTQALIHGMMKTVLKSAVADRIIPSNPMDGVPVPRRKDVELASARPGHPQDRSSFTVDEMRRMLETASRDVFAGTRHWWRLLTGMRQTEILGATLDDLDLRPVRLPDGRVTWCGYYTVNWKLEKMRKRHGCGEPSRGVWPCGFERPSKCPEWRWAEPDGFDKVPLTGQYCLTPPKSKRGKVVPIIPALGEVVHRYLEATVDVPNPYGLVFRRLDGGPLDSVRDLREFRELMRAAGIENPEGRYGHECRNSVVSLLFSMRVDPGIIQRIVGHSSLAMSEHYRSVPVEELMAGMETIGDGLGLAQIGWRDGVA